jgi:hypothetical protein
MLTCPDCQESFACPACSGGPESGASGAAASTATVTATAGAVGITIRRGDRRPWEEKWQSLTHHVKVLRDLYENGTPWGNIEVETRVASIFLDSYHLADWLKWDLANLPVTETEIVDYVKTSAPLQLADAICNTYKHSTRTRKGATTAGIRETVMTDGGKRYRVTIEIDWATPAHTNVDGLALAEQNVEAWRVFFRRHGIVPPS